MELEVTIPTRNLSYLQAKLNKLNKRASKLGCPPVSLEDTGVVKQVATGEEDVFGKAITIEAHVVRVYGEAPKINGWSFMGTIEHDPQGNMLRSIPGEEMPPEYRSAERRCDHCQKSRTRHHTYIVRNEEGDYKQVGRQCLRDFLGHQSPEAIARHAEWLMNLSASIEEEEGNFGSIGRYEFSFYTEGYLAWIACFIETKGWLSRSKEQEQGFGESTASLGLIAMDPRMSADRRDMHNLKPSEENWETGRQALAWCREELAPTITDQASEYEYNLVQACKAERTTRRNAGLVASVIVSWKKAKKRQKEASEFAKSDYVGKQGERITTTVKVLRLFTIDGNFGPTRIHKMQDEAGNVFIWFGHATPLDEDQTYNIKGTVKNHEFYRGVKQTVLTRCKVIDANG